MENSLPIRVLIVLVLLFAFQSIFRMPVARALTFTANLTYDADDANPGDGHCDADSGMVGDQCTLRAAISEVNALGGTHTINLDAYTYTLTQAGANEGLNATGDLDIGTTQAVTLTINGAGAGSTIVQAGTSHATAVDRVLEVMAGSSNVTINGVTITNGSPPLFGIYAGEGGGILNGGTLTLNDCVVTNNTTTDGIAGGPGTGGGWGGDGGGIENARPVGGASLTLNNCIVSNNTAGDGGPAGDVAGDGNATIGGWGGRGGGIYNTEDCIVTLNNTIIRDNVAGNAGTGEDGGLGGDGGGIYNEGTVVLDGATIYSNTTGAGGDSTGTGGSTDNGGLGGSGGDGGGICSWDGSVTISDSAITGNTTGDGGDSDPAYIGFLGGVGGSGGGVFVGDFLAVARRSTVTITHSTLSGNATGDGGWGPLGIPLRGQGGGVCVRDGTGSIDNATLSGNEASNGGGLAIDDDRSDVHISYSTIADNVSNGAGGGLYVVTGTVRISNTIVADNVDTMSTDPDCYTWSGSSVTSGGYNLIGDVATCSITGDTTGNIIDVDPRLSALADNGGDTETHALQFDSPAIDAASPVTCPAADQRDEVRDDLRCDIGAFELKYADSDTVMKTNMISGTQPVTYTFGPTLIKIRLTGGGPITVTAVKHDAPPGGGLPDAGEMGVHWTITASGSPYTATLGLCYTDAELGGLAEGSLQMYRWSGSSWDVQASTVYPSDNCVLATHVTQFSSWALGTAQPTAITSLNASTHSEVEMVGVVLASGLGLVFGLILVRRKEQ